MVTELILAIQANYGLHSYEAHPHRDGFIFTKGSDKKFVRRSRLSADRIMFNHMVKEHLAKSGFPYTDRYIVNNDGLPYAIYDGFSYTMVNKIDGKECSFDNNTDLARAALALAAMHEASTGGEYPKNFTFAKRELGLMPVIFRHRINELKRFKRVARKGKSKFDYIYLQEADYFIEEGEKILEDLNNSAYMTLVSKAANDNTICHRDFTQHNIILSGSNDYIIGFDNCSIEVKEYDIANFLRRKMRKCDWDLTIAKNMLDNYRSICKIKEEEFDVLKIIIGFPQKLWRIANKFYNSKRSWSEKGCLEKINEVINESVPLKNFLNSFDLIY